jgi:hypothetical protein
MLIVYSGGMHHIQTPGDHFPKIFKKIKIKLEITNIEKYKNCHNNGDHEFFKNEVIKDLTKRRFENLSQL